MWFKDKRVGRFEMTADDIEQNPEAVRMVLGSCLVVSAVMMIPKRSIEYYAICDDFEEVPEGEEPASYDVELAEDGTVTWTKQGG
jgi:hypothetical protein